MPAGPPRSAERRATQLARCAPANTSACGVSRAPSHDSCTRESMRDRWGGASATSRNDSAAASSEHRGGMASVGLRRSAMSVTQPGVIAGSPRDGFCNQLRQKIGVVYGNPETTTGGNTLKFYCSVRLDIRRKQAIKRGEEVVGSQCKVKVVKNSSPRRSARLTSKFSTAPAAPAESGGPARPRCPPAGVQRPAHASRDASACREVARARRPRRAASSPDARRIDLERRGEDRCVRCG